MTWLDRVKAAVAGDVVRTRERNHSDKWEHRLSVYPNGATAYHFIVIEDEYGEKSADWMLAGMLHGFVGGRAPSGVKYSDTPDAMGWPKSLQMALRKATA